MNFDAVREVIENRRTCKPALMNGKQIDDATITSLLQLGDWAPTHAHTEPWRFVVFAGGAVQQFCKEHADLYTANTPSGKYETAKYEKILRNGDLASHIVVVYMKRGTNPKITELEEICAVSAAVQNILLGTAALDIAALWSTGGLTLHPAMKTYFGLGEHDHMIGLLFLGYSEKAPKKGERIVPLEQKVEWRR